MSSSIKPSFTFDTQLSPWNVPAKDYLVQNSKQKEWDGLATATAVFNPEGKILLIQRAATDSMPNRWELPGGAVDDDDTTILHGAARELFEESGLIAKHFPNIVGEGTGQHFDPGNPPGQVFLNSTRTRVWCRFTFHVEVESCDAVKLDPKEHQDFAWVSEEELEERKIGHRELVITRETVAKLIKNAFLLRKQGFGPSLQL